MAKAEIHAFENEIFDHFRSEVKEKKKWIKKLKEEGFVVYEKGKKRNEDKIKVLHQ